MIRSKSREKYLLFFKECCKLKVFKLGQLRKEWSLSSNFIASMNRCKVVKRTSKVDYVWVGGDPDMKLVTLVHENQKKGVPAQKQIKFVHDKYTGKQLEIGAKPYRNPDVTMGEEQAIALLKKIGGYRIIKITEQEL